MGILEKPSTQEKTEVRRRALSAKEILNYLRKEGEKQLSLHSVYFHLQKFVDAGYLKTIVILKEGRHNVTYFGRTARIFTYTDEEEYIKKNIRLFNEFAKVIKLKYPQRDLTGLDELVKDYVRLVNERDKRINEWVAKNENYLTECNPDIIEFAYILNVLDLANPEYYEIAKKLTELFEIKI